MATIGFIRNDVTRAEEQPLWLSLGLDVAAVVAVAALLGRAAGHTG